VSEAIVEEVATDITALYNRLVILADPKAEAAFDEADDRLQAWLEAEQRRKRLRSNAVKRAIRMTKAVDERRYH